MTGPVLGRRLFAAASLSGAVLVVLGRYVPTSVSEPFGPGNLSELFAIFLFWFAAVVGWGRAAAAAIRLGRSLRLSRAA